MSSIVSSSSVVNGSSVCLNRSGLKNNTMLGDGVGYAANNSTSPLQIFVRAKKKINDIFQEIEEYVAESAVFVESEF